MYAVGRDTTERRRADAELREAQHALEASRDELRLLADEQAALRRVATMVAQDAPADGALPAHRRGGRHAARRRRGETWAATTDGKAMSPLAMWSAHGDHPPAPDPMPIEPGSLAPGIVRTGSPRARTTGAGWESVTATLVRDQLGRAVLGRRADRRRRQAVGRDRRPLDDAIRYPPSTEARLERFCGARRHRASRTRTPAARCGGWRTSRRRCGGSPRWSPGRRRRPTVFRRSPTRSAGCSSVDSVAMVRYEERADRASSSRPRARSPTRSRSGRARRSGATTSPSLVFGTGRAARIDDYAREASGPFGEHMRAAGARSIVATPITVEGRLWGAMLGHRRTTRPAAPGHRDADRPVHRA